DAFQATFLVLVRRAHGLHGCGSLAGWLYTVAYHAALKARAARARRGACERQDLDMLPAEPTRDPESRETRAVLAGELRGLPEGQRTLVVLCYREGKTHEQAARELGWPVGSVSKRMARARDALRRRLVRRGVALSAGLLGTLLAGQTAEAVPAPLAGATLRAAAVMAAGAAGAGAGARPAGGRPGRRREARF